MKTALPGTSESLGQIDGRFGLKIALSVPVAAAPLGVSGLMKPLLDGVISAFHRHDGTDGPELSSRIGKRLGTDSSAISRLLLDGGTAVLGERRLAWRLGDGVQWNPRDDDCVDVEIIVRASAGEGWSCSGSLFAVAAST